MNAPQAPRRSVGPRGREGGLAGVNGRARSAPPDLTRWSGAANALAGVLVPAFALLHPENTSAGVRAPGWLPAHALLLAALVLMLLGLIGLYARHLRAQGGLAGAGFVLAFVGTAVVSGLFYAEAFVFPLVAAQAPDVLGPPPFTAVLAPVWPAVLLPYACSFVGVALLGLAVLRAEGLPRRAGPLLVLGLPFALGPLVPRLIEVGAAALFGAGLLSLGYAQWAWVADPTRGRGGGGLPGSVSGG